MFIRAGLAGHELPIYTFENNNCSLRRIYPPFLDMNDLSLTLDETNKFKDMLSLDEQLNKLCHIFQKESVHWMDFSSVDEDLHLRLHQIFLVIFNIIKLRLSNCKVIIIDNCKLPLVTKSIISQILLLRMGLRSLQFMPKPVLSVISGSHGDGLIIDIGWNSCKIIPVIDYTIIENQIYENLTDICGLSLHYRIVESLITHDSRLLDEPNLFQIIESFIVNCIFVRPDKDTENGSGSFNIGDIKIPSNLRYKVVEDMIFTNNNLVNIVNKVIDNNSIDVRKSLRENILFDGGITNIPGLKTRLLNDLRSNTNKYYKANASLGSWAGASIFCSTSIKQRTKLMRKTEEITKENIKSLLTPNGIQLTKFPDVINRS